MLLKLIYSHMSEKVKSNLAFKAGGTDGTSKASFRRWKGAAKQLRITMNLMSEMGLPTSPVACPQGVIRIGPDSIRDEMI